MNNIIFPCHFGLGAQLTETSEGPSKLIELYGKQLEMLKYKLVDEKIDIATGFSTLKSVAQFNAYHGKRIFDAIKSGEQPVVIGGDHSIAIGTWSGVITALDDKDFGLLWIDAHLDAHICDSSPSKALHGMPVRFLLGEGDSRLSRLLSAKPKLKPENILYFGIRSYEKEEYEYLNNLGVEVYFMDDVLRMGQAIMLEKVLKKMKDQYEYFGISIDLDYFDPSIAPGVGSPEPDGGDTSILKSLRGILGSKQLRCVEVVEFNPRRDIGNATANLLFNILKTIKK